MIRLNINSLKHGVLFLDFNTQEEVDAYIAQNEISGHWGKDAYTEVIQSTDDTPEHTIEHPATVTYSVTPSPVVQENINKESLKYLADTDWYILREVDAGIPCPVEIKTLRAAARLKIV